MNRLHHTQQCMVHEGLPWALLQGQGRGASLCCRPCWHHCMAGKAPGHCHQCTGAGRAPRGTGLCSICTGTNPIGASGREDAVTVARWLGAACALNRRLSQSCALTAVASVAVCGPKRRSNNTFSETGMCVLSMKVQQILLRNYRTRCKSSFTAADSSTESSSSCISTVDTCGCSDEPSANEHQENGQPQHTDPYYPSMASNASGGAIVISRQSFAIVTPPEVQDLQRGPDVARPH